jgi:Type I restriction modification DNA specificity domain.
MYTGNSISKTVKDSKYSVSSEGYPYIATKDIVDNNKINYDNGIKIPINERNFKHSPPNSLLLCIEGGSAGRKMAVNEQMICFGNKLCNFTPYGFDSKWLFLYIQSSAFYINFQSNMSGIIGGVGLNKLKEIIIPLAPINENNKIIQGVGLLYQKIAQLD